MTTDLSLISDEELLSIASQPQATDQVASLSDEQLFSIAGIEPSQPSTGVLAGVADRTLDLGAKLISGIGGVAETGGDFLDTMAPIPYLRRTPEQIEADTIRPYFDSLAGVLRSGQEKLNYQPTVTWEDVKQNFNIPDFGSYILEQTTRSIPDMVAAFFAPAPYLMSRSEEIAQSRAEADNRESADITDYGVSTPLAAGITLAERFGAKGLLPKGTAGKTVSGRIAKAAGKEAGTEAIQEGLEYTGERAGTETGMSLSEMVLDRMLPGAVTGGSLGGAVRAVSEVPNILPQATEALSGAAQSLPDALAEAQALISSRAGSLVPDRLIPYVPSLDGEKETTPASTQAVAFTAPEPELRYIEDFDPEVDAIQIDDIGQIDPQLRQVVELDGRNVSLVSPDPEPARQDFASDEQFASAKQSFDQKNKIRSAAAARLTEINELRREPPAKKSPLQDQAAGLFDAPARVLPQTPAVNLEQPSGAPLSVSVEPDPNFGSMVVVQTPDTESGQSYVGSDGNLYDMSEVGSTNIQSTPMSFETEQQAQQVAQSFATTQQPELETTERQNEEESAPTQVQQLQESGQEASAENESDTTSPKGEGGTDPRTNQFAFSSQAFTDRPSWQRKVFSDAGYNPDAASNFSPERQFKIMRKAIKDRYGISVVSEKNALINQSLDQMADLYANLETFAYVLGLPYKAISLSKSRSGRPSLTLNLQKNAPYLGVFYPNENTIGLPGRSNSFAHEWGHALDFFMLEQIENSKEYEGMSGKVRNAGADYTPDTASEAWVNLMQSIFFEQDALAAELVRLETQLEKTRSDKQRKAIEERIESIKSGKTKIRQGRTDYYKNASSIGSSYWTKPTEMLARSFEAYIANRVQAAGGSLEVLSKSDKGYMSSSDDRFVKTFPKASDRDNIFRAYDMLFENLATQSILNPNGDPVVDPSDKSKDYLDAETIWNRDNPNAPVAGLKGLYQRELKGMQQQIRENQQEKSRPKNTRKLLDKVANGFSYLLRSDQQVFRMLEGRYKGAISLRRLADMYAKRPGSGFSGFIDSKGRRWGTYEEEVDSTSKKFSNIMMRIMDQYGLDQTDLGQMDLLRSALLGQEGRKIPAPITKAAGEFRKVVYDAAWAHGKNSGLDIGYAKDIAFLNRIYDVPLLSTQETKFKESASQVYDIEFENILGQKGDVDLSIIFQMFKEVDNKRLAQSPSQPPRYRSRDEDSNSVVKQLRKLQKDLQKEKDPKKKKLIESKMQDAVSQIYDELKADYSEASSNLWFKNLISPNAGIEAYSPPRASFLKSRKLPPETDEIMKDFMINNPVELMHTYITEMSSEAAWERRKSSTNRFLDDLITQGVHPDDIDTVQNIIETVTGKSTKDYFGKKTYGFFNGLRALGTLYLLPRAVFASLPEAMTVGIRTGNAMDGLHAMALVIKDVVSNTKSTQDRMKFAQEMMLVANAFADQAIANRLGGTFEDSPRWNKLMRNMFERTMLAPLTRKQHAVVAHIGDIYIRRLSKKIMDSKGKKEPGKKSAYNTYVSDLVELGVPRSEVEGFAKFMTDKEGERVTLKEIEETPHGQSYRIALERVRSESVQTSAAVERSSFAKSELGKAVMGITSFMFSYFENIVKATPKRVWRTYMESGASMATQRAIAGYLPAAMQLWMAHTIVMLVRTALFNPDRLEEWEEKGELAENLMMAGMSQMGLYGPGADLMVNAYEGVRYQRDLANMAVGPYIGTYLQNAQKVISPLAAGNSEKSNTTEFRALQGAYGLMSPAISYGLNYVPAGPVLGRTIGLSNMYATSGAASEHFAEMVVGPKGAKTKGNFQRGREK